MNPIARVRVRYHRMRNRLRMVSALLHGRSVMYGVRVEGTGTGHRLTMLYPKGEAGDCQFSGLSSWTIDLHGATIRAVSEPDLGGTQT